jgi:hypothetical protein
VGWRDDDRGRLRPGELVDDQAAVVDGNEDRVQARAADEDRHVQVPRVLDGDRGGARGSQCSQGEGGALGEPAADHHVVRACECAANTLQIRRDDRSQHDRALGIAVPMSRAEAVRVASPHAHNQSGAGKLFRSGRPGAKSSPSWRQAWAW